MSEQTSIPLENKTNRQLIIENIVSLAFALVIVFMIRSSLIEAFKIPSGSMIPTLMIGDHIFVNKLAYGVKIPFSDLFGDGSPTYILKRDLPKRGDIIVFKYPKDESFYYIKRVIGVPGDQIEVRNKVVYINNQMINRDLLPSQKMEPIFTSIDDSKYTPENIDIYTEHLNSVDHAIMLDKTNFTAENHGPITIPQDNLFVMGDNRDFSNDSRFWGFVPMKNVKGKAMFVWMSLWVHWPWDNIPWPLEQASDLKIEFRPERIGTVLH